MKLFLVLLLYLSLIILVKSNPLKNPNICGRPTCAGNGKFRYGPFTRQNYKYTVDVASLFNGTSKNESRMSIEAATTLDFLTSCDGLLTFKDVKLIDGKNAQLFSEAISEHTLRFSFQDGIITEVCPHQDEQTWVLNFKKGLLSLIHNTMKRFDLDHTAEEEDVRGKCRTTYKVKGAKETSLIIEKTKDLDSCKGRSKIYSFVQTSPYSLGTKEEQSALLRSSSSCELSVDHYIYNDIICEERYIFEPFSNKDAGATTIMKQRLKLVDENTDTVYEQPPIVRRTPLLFDYVPSPKPTSGELRTSRDLVKELCKLSTDNIQTKFSDLFTKFIHSSRLLSYTAISTLYERSSSICPTGRKHILDALPYVINGASVSLMKDIIVNGEVPQSTVDEWLWSIAFISHPDNAMLEAMAELLQSKGNLITASLSASALTYSYCTQNRNCIENNAVNTIINLLQDKVITSYKVEKKSRETDDSLVVALKALSNIGVVTEGFREDLKQIVEDVQVDPKIRVAAVETHRRFPCADSLSYFEKLLRNQDQDVEVRIAAYLQVMRCPNYLVIRSIRHCLEVEEVNQVGSFIWSHLNNILESSIPSRVEIQGLLSDKDLNKKFSSDVRKFSHNFEGSVFFEEYNAGANYESNVIFSPSSYIPKSAMLNLTVDIFGESINLLEVYGRIEGFEHYLETVFGPNGPLDTNNLKEKIPRMRWGRSASQQELLKSQISSLPIAPKNSFDEQKVSLGLKVFGNDIKYVSMEGNAEINEALNKLNPVDYIKRILSGREISYNKAAMFLDSSYVVPTGAGMPLTLNAVGTASINLKLFGSLQMTDFSKNKELELTGNIHPSVALDVIGTMSVDGYYSNTGIKLKTNMYTSTSLEGNIKVKGNKLVSVKFGIPRETTEIFGAKSEIIVMKNEVEEPQKGLEKSRISESLCSSSVVEKTIGLKLCADYSFANVTKSKNSTYFFLSGPASFRLSLQKSDPSAKTYLLEYKWVQHKNSSVISLTFDTPGSNLRRLLGANLTIDTDSQNLTLLLQSTAGTVLARGKYKNTVEEKYLQMSLDINNKKHFDVSCSLDQKEIRNGYNYLPKFYLSVNGERVVDMFGIIKSISKKGITQYDVDLKFQTKRLTSKLFGYISKTGASIATNLKLDYKFANTKEQRAVFDFSVANRSTQNLVVIKGDCSLTSTAYPNFNFQAAGKLQRGGGHTECKLEVSSNPLPESHPEAEYRKLSLQMMMSYKVRDSTRLTVIASLGRPSTDLDMRLQFSYDATVSDLNILTVVRYAKNKDVAVTVYYSHPRGTFEHVEGRVNVTVPSFQPMIVEVKIHEKQTADYVVEVKAAWFSRHSISARGIYQDKSTSMSSDHHVKFLLKSPSFEEINADCQFYRNDNLLKIDLKADQSGDDYEIFLKHRTNSTFEILTEGRVKYKTKLYTLTSALYLKEHRKILLELHLDQFRDVHLATWGFSTKSHKAAGMELKWDANRDPNQKLAVTVDFRNPVPYDYAGNFVLSYPGRTINGVFDFLLKAEHFSTSSRLSWSTEESLVMRVKADYRHDTETLLYLESEVITPFDGWRKTAFNGGFHHAANMYRANSSLYWQRDQHISIDLFADHGYLGQTFTCEFAGSLASTVHDIPSLSATLKHRHNSSRTDSNLRVTYHPQQAISIRSIWQIDEDIESKNLTGTVTLNSPFKGFTQGLLISKIYTSNQRYIRGVADLDLDHKKFTTSVEGIFQKITRNMLVVNITTPLEKYSRITGRFGISDERKHIVAQVLYPSNSLGIDVLFNVHSITDFDTKFSLATPVEFLQKILIVGKLKSEEADFRAGWNTLLGGFVGVWHYSNITDFDYSYKIYTPIEGFEENGLVVKLIFREGLDFELSAKLAQHKLGATVVGKSKPRILKELGVKTLPIYMAKDDLEEAEDYEDYDEEESDEPLSWAGLIEIDTLMYPTMKGTLDVDQQGTVYVILGTLILPDGKAELKDEFDMTDVFKMKNRFELSTPYETYKLVTSNYDFQIKPGYRYLLALDLNYQNSTRWIKTGALAHYVTEAGDDDYDRFNVTVHVHTPFETLPYLDINAVLQTAENAYRGNFSITTNNSDISAAGKVKVDESFLGTDLDMNLKTPLITVPPVKLYFMKNFTETASEALLKFGLTQDDRQSYKLDSGFRYESIKNCAGHVTLRTPFRGMELSKGAIDILITDKTAEVYGTVILYPLDVQLNTTAKDSVFHGMLLVDFNNKRNDVILNCKVLTTSEDRRELSGVLTVKDKVFIISGSADMSEDIPVTVQIQLEQEGGSEPLNFNYQLHPQQAGYALRASVQHLQKFAHFEAHITTKHKYDWELHLQVHTSHQEYKTFVVHTKAKLDGNNRSIEIDARTPIPKLGNPKITLSFEKLGVENLAKLNYDVAGIKGDAEACIAWAFLENMKIKVTSIAKGRNSSKEFSGEVFYINPEKSFKYLTLGGYADINKIWTTLLNLTVELPGNQQISVEGKVKFPPPNDETHAALGKFSGDRNMDNFEYLLLYHTLQSAHKYGSSGKVSYESIEHLNGVVDVEWNGKHVNNYLVLRRPYKTLDLLYKLRTPKFINEETFVTNLKYRWSDTHRNVTCQAFFPSSRSIGFANIDFQEFGNMNGTVNVTTPFKAFNYTGADFKTETNAVVYNRYLLLFWPNNTAFIDSKCNTYIPKSTVLERNTRGSIIVQVPLTTRHTANVDYTYKEALQLSTGQATVEYNRKKILEGKYNCLSESRAGFDKDTIHVELENKLVPIGADYVHQFEYSAPVEGSNKPTVDSKLLNLYHLHNATKFNVTGKIRVRATLTGQQIALTAIHSNRTVNFLTDYDVLDQCFKQHSKIELAPTAWLEYNLELLNNTVDENSEAQQIRINISYPRRTFTAKGSYNMSTTALSSDMSVMWDKQQKTVQAGFDWKRDQHHPNRQEVELRIKHPSFEKDISLLGEYSSVSSKYADVGFTIDYSRDPGRTVKLGGIVENKSNTHLRNYTYGIWATHSATNLDLNARGGVYWKPRWYHTKHISDYKRSYLPLQSSEASARLDVDQNEIEFKRLTLRELSYFWGTYDGKFPVYTANVSAIHGSDYNASGDFYINFVEKLVQLELNMTTDGSQSLHMYGFIPDARSAFFDIWRDYEEIRISDVAYLLRLNHSRLIVSSLLWRPHLKQDVQSGIRAASVGLYNDIIENTDYWKQYIRSEAADAVTDVWQDAKPLIQDFLDDLKDLKVLEEDIEELTAFLNKSYNANEFYIRDIVGFVVYVFEELSIKSHIESLPAIVNEIWEVMGDTGKKIQRSIIWFIEKLKSYYKNAAEFINGLVQGDSVEHLSEALQQLVEKYDNFIKDLHVSFIKYMEELWKQTYALMLHNWHRTLASIEPTFLKIVHYLETIIWNTGKEFLDFLYIRKNELIEHPYFSKLSNFTHDLDVFYKDMTGNDTIASIYKYTKVVWNFLKEKYFKLVPFGKELQDIVSEILEEISELRKLPSVQYVIDKYNLIYREVETIWEYFDMENRMHRFITLLHRKLTHMTQTALQTENRFREAKTKFVFEPSDGVMYLEQKLPMSWHAFNETPKFQEIPEFKVFYDWQNYFAISRNTFWNFYYDYKPYTDPADWLPPFKAQAMIIGGRHFVTFDRTYYDFQGDKSYLLTSDISDRNFSIVVSYESKNSTEILVLVNNSIVHINVVENSVRLGDEKETRLPLDLGETFLYQDADLVTVESRLGFILQCNMKFDICMLEVSGFYFGKTAGLWGTLNNEPSDDLLMPDRQKAMDTEKFAESWSLDRPGIRRNRPLEVSSRTSAPDDVQKLCEAIFTSKVSPFVTCFSRVLSEPFLSMCLNSTSEGEACTSAVAYMNLCWHANTPLRIPDSCVKCNLLNGTQVPEGTFLHLDGDSVPQSADVVFIIEAKDCNSNVLEKGRIADLMQELNKELVSAKLTQNRYAVVVFGGDGIFNKPRSIAIDNQIFTDHNKVLSYFEKIPTGKGNLDIFQALIFANKLIFRPGVSKSFILLPCSRCHESDMKLDYAILHQLLQENDVTLHILMNEDFHLQKTRANKIFFGVDRTRAFTKKDIQEFKGDASLRREVRLPKSKLGFCTPLALETNGSVFSRKRLVTEKLNAAKKYLNVFAKRVALTAVPSTCKMCECTAPNTGISYMECFPCNHPTHAGINFGFNEDEALAVMQPADEELFNYSE